VIGVAGAVSIVSCFGLAHWLLQEVLQAERSVVVLDPTTVIYSTKFVMWNQTHVAREIVRTLGSIPTVIILSQVR